MFKKIWNFLTVPRYIEFGILEDETEEQEMPDLRFCAEAAKIVVDSKRMLASFHVRKEFIMQDNEAESLELLIKYEKSRALKEDGLLISNKQAKEEAIITYNIYKEAGLIDSLNKIKPGVEEGLKDYLLNKI